jgi:predicted transposase YbfD/YdcC
LILSSFNNNPGITHWKQVVHCWKYVKGSRHLHLTPRPTDLEATNSIQHYTDATWADDLKTQLSRSGSICFWKSCPVAWSSKKQRNITLLSTKAEMNALSDGVQENQWIKFLVEELWNEQLDPSTFHFDNQGLIEKIKIFGSNSKT